MIGNDVVDFQKALLESNWHRKGYLEKLFSIEEQNFIADAPDPHRMVWLLWTMKEASYKIHFRQCPTRSFQPQKISCYPVFIDEDRARGTICYDGYLYFSSSMFTKNFIHTLSVGQPIHLNEVRVLMGRDFKGNYDLFLKENHLEDHCIIKNQHQIPTLLNRMTGERFFLSISHHGRFMSLVYGTKTKEPACLSIMT